MAANSLSILIDIKEKGAAVLSGLEDGLKRVDMAGRAYSSTLASSNAAVNSFTGSIARLAAALGGVELFKNAILSGLKFNDTVEQSRIGIAALIRTFNDFTDANGKAAKAGDAYQKSVEMAVAIQGRLRVAGLATNATYEQLLNVLSENYGFMNRAQMTSEQMVIFMTKMVQAGAALRVPMDQMGQEIRTLMNGVIDRNARIGQGLNLNGALLKQMIAEGKGFEYLNEKLEEFGIAGQESAKTMTGAFSNLKDAIQNALGSALNGTFQNTKKLILDLTAAIVTIDEKAGTFKFSDNIINAFKRVDDAIVKAVGGIGNIKPALDNAVDIFSSLAVVVIDVAGALGKMFTVIGPILPDLIKYTAYLKLLQVAFKAFVGLPYAIGLEILGMARALNVLSGGAILGWIASLRTAFAALAATLGVTATALGGLVIAGGFAVQKIGELVVEIYKYITGMREVARLENEQKNQGDFLKSKDTISKLEAINKATGLNIKSMEEFNKLANAGKITRSSEAGSQWQLAPTVTPKEPPEDPNFATDRERLEKQLAADLIKLSGDKWTVLRNQAKAHYAEQVEMAHGNQALILQAKKVYQLELSKIAKDQADVEGKEAKRSADAQIKEQERIGIAQAKSQAARAKAATETALAVLEDVYKRGEVSIADYFKQRMDLINIEYDKEIKALEAQLAAELDISQQIGIQDQIFEKQEAHKRKILEETQKQLEAEKKLKAAQEEINQILSNVALRTMGRGDSTLDATFAQELAQLDQQQAEEKKRFDESLKLIQDLNQQKALSDELYRRQKLEKDKLMMDQERRLNDFRLESARNIASGLVSIFTGLYEASGKKSKEFFLLAKAAAVAEAIVNTAQAVTKAYAQGGIWGMAQAAVIAAAGGVQIAKIQAQTLAYGGMVGGWSPNKRADNVPIWATSGEFMQPVDTVRYYGRSVMEALRRRMIPRDIFDKWQFSIPSPSGFALAGGGSVPAGGAASFMVTVPVTVNGASKADRLARILPAEIEETVKRVMREELR